MRLRTGTTGLLAWDAPEPVAVDPAPALTVRIAGASVAGLPDLEVVVAPATTTAVSSDLKRLTLAGALADSARAAGERWGKAWLVTASDGVFPIRVNGIVTVEGVSTLTLADPLPRRPASAAGTVQWARWTASLGAAVTAESRRDITWQVSWRPLHAGAAADDATDMVDEGRLIVARSPFSTGLTSSGLGDVFTDLAQTTPGRDSGRDAVIAAAAAELELELGPHLAPRGLYPDDIDGGHLHLAHAYLAAAMVVEKAEPTRAKRLRETAAQLFEKGLRQIWIDVDRDGVVDEAEEVSGPAAPVALAPARLSDLFTTHTTPMAPRYYPGRPR